MNRTYRSLLALASLILLVSMAYSQGQSSRQSRPPQQPSPEKQVDPVQEAIKAAANSNRPVEEALKMAQKSIDSQTPPAVLAAGEQGLAEVTASGIAKKALNVGAKMPAFALPDANGKAVKSADLLAQGPIVLVFYRGQWCPFCNLYLRSLQAFVPKFQELGASLVAISQEAPDKTQPYSQEFNLTYTVLSDVTLNTARQFGIVYNNPKAIAAAQLGFGFDLKKYTNSKKGEVPLAATYVIDRKGKIVYAFLDPDYKKRAEPKDILAVLEKLK